MTTKTLENEDPYMAEKEEEKEIENEEEETSEEKKAGKSKNQGESRRKVNLEELDEELKKSGEDVSEKISHRKRRIRGSIEPATPIERPLREKKTIDRYVGPSSEKASTAKVFSIEKGRGTPLKDIPNVFFKLSKRKPDENLQILHSILFGKRPKVHSLKRNINQFSGFVWVENEEKQRLRIKEKLDRCVKEKLLDFCDVLDIPVSKMRRKKEDLLEKLMKFLESPHATTKVSIAEKEQLQKGNKQKRKSPASGVVAKRGSAAQNKKKKQSTEPKNKIGLLSEVEKDGDVNEFESSESRVDSDDAKDDQMQEEMCEQGSESDEEDKVKQQESKGVPGEKNVKHQSEAKRGTCSVRSPQSPRPLVPSPKSKMPSSEKQKEDEKKSQENQHTPSKGVNKSNKSLSTPVTDLCGKAQGNGQENVKRKAEPTREAMHAIVTTILKEVDFNTATLSDILKKLGTHFDLDLMNRKVEVKSIIEDVLSSMTDDEEDEPEVSDENAHNVS